MMRTMNILGMLLELLQYLDLVELWVDGQMGALGMELETLVTAAVEIVMVLHWVKMLKNTIGLEKFHLLPGLLDPTRRFNGMWEQTMQGDIHTGYVKCQKVVSRISQRNVSRKCR